MQRRQIESQGERPNLPHPVIVGDQLLQTHRPQRHLPPLRPPQPRHRDADPHRRRLLRKLPKQPTVRPFDHNHHHISATTMTNLLHPDARWVSSIQYIHSL